MLIPGWHISILFAVFSLFASIHILTAIRRGLGGPEQHQG
jgi:hypothetical protein